MNSQFWKHPPCNGQTSNKLTKLFITKLSKIKFWAILYMIFFSINSVQETKCHKFDFYWIFMSWYLNNYCFKKKIFNHNVAHNFILNNFNIESFIEISLVWLLLKAVFKRCYYGNHNATDNRSEYCKFMYNIIIIKYSVSRIQFPPVRSFFN